MRRKFVQIAAFILAISMLFSVSFAAEDTGAVQEPVQSPTTGDLPEGSEDGNTEQGSDESSDSSNDNSGAQDETESGEDDTDSGQSDTDPEDANTDSEQDTAEPNDSDPAPDEADPETENPDVSTDNGSENPDVPGDSDPEDPGVNDPEEPEGSEDPEEPTDPEGSEEPEEPADPDVPEEPADPDVPEEPEIIIPQIPTEAETGRIIRVGLNFGSSALTSANLENSVGSGYRFGYIVGETFYRVGYTAERKISVLKTKNLYYSPELADGFSGYSETVTNNAAVGSVHLQFPGTYSTFDEAKAVAESLGGFPAWINGEFVVRFGTFLTADDARAALTAHGFSDATVVGTSVYGLIVVITGTNTPVFQYDGGQDFSALVVKPGTDENVKSITHYKGYRYYGSFRFDRIDGGDITTVNLSNVDDYVRCVIPYEMSPSWPLEALKAQAVAARSYAIANTNSSHKKNGFDVCTSIHCQVYYGTSGTSARTDQAVDETAGLFAWYEDQIILGVFHSSNGGATENSENVWYQALPYLRGVIDIYEPLVANKNVNSSWTKTYTGKQLQEILNAKGYMCSEIVGVSITPTPTGNVQKLTLTDSNGKNWSFSKYENIKTLFGLKSVHYSITGSKTYSLTDEQIVNSLQGAWVLTGDGELVQVDTSPAYAMTANGLEEILGSEISGDEFVFSGGGNGHNLGLSQWGAYAMAYEGFTYDQILKFYYTGIEIHE